MRIQSAGTGLLDGAFFSALGEALVLAELVDAAGLGVALVVLGAFAAGLEPQPAATSVSAHTESRYFFIDPPNKIFVLEIRPEYQAGKLLPGYLTELQGNLRN